MNDLHMPGPADWALWSQMSVAPLWEAIVLSMGRSPADREAVIGLLFFSDGRLDQKDKKYLAECLRRMRIAVSHMSNGGPIKPLRLHNRQEADSRNTISLPQFGDWARGLGWKLPDQFPRSQKLTDLNRALSTTERNTLLTIIAVLCKEARLDYTKAAKTAGLIQSTAASMGVSIGETTIENHLKKIPDALGTRTR